MAPAVVLGHAAIIGVLAAPAAEAAVGRAAVAAISRSPTVARVVAAIGAAFKGEQARKLQFFQCCKEWRSSFFGLGVKEQTAPQRKLLRALRGKRPWR